MTWRRLAIGIGVALALAWPAAAGEEPRRISLEILVAHIADGPGGIDPRGRELHRQLADQFRYEALRVLDQQRLDLPLGTVESLKLPNGRQLNVRAFQLSSKGVLLGVTVTGSLQTDLRVPNGHLVVIGAERYEDGKLVISLQPSW